MRISHIRCSVISHPLPAPLHPSWAPGRTFHHNVCTLVEVSTDGGLTGVGALPHGDPIGLQTVANLVAPYILGKDPGRTTLILIREDASIISTIDVRVAPDVTELKRRLSDVLPDETIEVLPANDGLVLSGTVSGPEAVERALELATHYAKGRVSNLLNVEVQEQAPEPVPEPVAVVLEEPAEPVDTVLVQSQIRKILPDEPISVHELGGTVVLSGDVSSQERANQALQVARLIAGDAEVSNLMTVAQKKSCKMRTRRGGELVETEIPCQESS